MKTSIHLQKYLAEFFLEREIFQNCSENRNTDFMFSNLLPKNHVFYELTLRRLMSYIYIYGAPILDVSRSHTTTQHSR